MLGTFAPDGPLKCSGLDVCRFDGGGLAHELGSEFQLVRELPYQHLAPAGKVQSFCFAVFRHRVT
ncbi:MAG: hypothetical protein U0795_25160 [Pirellulales bacterium]